MPFVSVVVPAYNAQDTVGACIESLLAQGYPEGCHEIIVVDNNSDDDTSDVVSRYPVTLLHERGKQSASAARNLGIKYARGDIIAFTDADCVADVSWLTNLLADWEDPTIGCFTGLIKAYQPQSAVAVLLGRYQLERFYQQSYAAGGNCAYRPAILAEIGLFDDTLRSSEDVELSIRMQKQTGKQIAFVEEAVVYHPYPSTIRTVFYTSHFRGYGQGMVNEKHCYRPPLRRYVWVNLKAVVVHSYYFARRVLANPWRRRSEEQVLDHGLRAIVRLGAVLGHLHHALDKALGRDGIS